MLRFYRTFMESAPDELTSYAFVLRVPSAEPFPKVFHGNPAVALMSCHVSATTEGEAALQPLQEFGDPLLTAIQRMPYVALQQSFDAGMATKRNRWYTKAHFLRALR